MVDPNPIFIDDFIESELDALLEVSPVGFIKSINIMFKEATDFGDQELIAVIKKTRNDVLHWYFDKILGDTFDAATWMKIDRFMNRFALLNESAQQAFFQHIQENSLIAPEQTH